MKRKRIVMVILMVVAIILLLSGCADASKYTLEDATNPYGFWGGVWHGFIMVPDFIGSLFCDDIAVYAVNNNGGWYNFGFVGGLGFSLRLIGYFINGIFGN